MLNNDIPSKNVRHYSNFIKHSYVETSRLSQNSHSIIPKTIHIVWVSGQDKSIPKFVLRNVETWKNNNPSWDVIIWNSSMVRENLSEQFVNLVENITVGAWKSDLLRYKILYEFGGIYVDADIVSLRSVEEIVRISEEQFDGVFSVCERLTRPTTLYNNLFVIQTDCATICNAVIGARKGHPALKYASELSVYNSLGKSNYSIIISGPPMWTYVLNTFRIGTLKEETFYPCKYYEPFNCIVDNFKNNETVYAMHEWRHTWW